MNAYLKNANAVVQAQESLTEEQRKAVMELEKKIADNNRVLTVALRLIEADEKDGLLTKTQAKKEKALAEIDCEEETENLTKQIKAISPSWNVTATISEVAEKAGSGSVHAAGKAATVIGKFLRPFVQATAEAIDAAKNAASEPYSK